MANEVGISPMSNVSIPAISVPGKTRVARLVARVRSVETLSEFEIMRMHALFCEYYENHDYERFKRDLLAKDDAILLSDAKAKTIEGFSTLLKVEFRKGRRSVRGIYSGDTVLSKAYWGSPALGAAFLKYLWVQKIKSPLTPLYWFLISKGYKTYLLMANNFLTHYPRFERRIPADIQGVMDDFYGSRFAGSYDAATGLMKFQGASCHLKDDVADISPKDLLNRRIAFFAERNPDWKAGTELCCVAEMTLEMPARYMVKKFLKGMFR